MSARVRVAVTGLGLVSSIGNDLNDVVRALRAGTSGIAAVPEYAAHGLSVRIAGLPDLSAEPDIPRRVRRYMGDAPQYAHHAMRRAVADAALSTELLQDPSTGLVVGSGVGSLVEHEAAMATFRAQGPSRVPPYAVPRVMGNTVSAALTVAFGVRGASYGIVSACASGAHAIGHAADLIRLGRQRIVIAGAAEEARWPTAVLFGSMGALSSGGDATASRPFDTSRDGFVLAGGAGVLVLEDLEHARARGARIYGEVAGYGATSDGDDMVTPSSEGAARAMRLAIDEAGVDIDYVNAHATSTPVGDLAELRALKSVFGERMPPVSSTKGQTGHAVAAAGAIEAVLSLLMMREGFMAANAHLATLDAEAEGLPLLRVGRDARLDAVLSNSMGFGGTNASLVFRRVD